MIIDGKAIAQTLKNNIAQQVALLERKPGLAVVLVGDNPASQVYVNHKEKACREVGFYSKKIQESGNISQTRLLAIIRQLNDDDAIDGILIQLPLPKSLDTLKIIEAIDPNKDVDGFCCQNTGKLMQNQSFLRPCTPKGIMTLLQISNINVLGKQAVVVGASNVVGRPMAIELLNQGATITVCNSKTKNLGKQLQQADIIIIAMGQAKMITADMVKSGAVVIDVGINRLDNGLLVGDVDFDQVKDKASFITPVPGGVGPMTIASLLDNTLISYHHREKQ